jgi:hypothetical protein
LQFRRFLAIFLLATFFLQKKAIKDQGKAYKDYLKDSLSVLEDNNKYMKRVAEALEEKSDGK